MNIYLKKIKEKGFDAFFVGGYVRDNLLGRNTFDIDIATNASLSDLKSIFKDEKYKCDNWCLMIINNPYQIQITPYRIEEDYDDYRHPSKIEKASDIFEDSKRRDFTINALYQNEKGKIYDFYGGLDHLRQKKLVMIGNASNKIKEDPLRILRALRFVSIYDLTFDKALEDAIIENKELLNKVSSFRKKQELEKIYQTGNIDIIKKYHVQKYFYLDENFKQGKNIYEFWKQADISKYPFTKEELEKIKET